MRSLFQISVLSFLVAFAMDNAHAQSTDGQLASAVAGVAESLASTVSESEGDRPGDFTWKLPINLSGLSPFVGEISFICLACKDSCQNTDGYINVANANTNWVSAFIEELEFSFPAPVNFTDTLVIETGVVPPGTNFNSATDSEGTKPKTPADAVYFHCSILKIRCRDTDGNLDDSDKSCYSVLALKAANVAGKIE